MAILWMAISDLWDAFEMRDRIDGQCFLLSSDGNMTVPMSATTSLITFNI